MIVTADEREAWQLDWSGNSSCTRLRITSSSQQSSPPRSRTGGAVTLRQRQKSPLGTLGFLLILVGSLWATPTSAVFIEFQNCLSESYQNNPPIQLQFVPKFLDVVFNTTDPSHNLRVTVWGNVTGSGPGTLIPLLPPANDTAYWNSNQTDLGGKIENIPDSDVNKLTTLFNKVNVLTYLPWSQSVDFCNQLVNATCPLGPSFTANG